jgi:hypothetical protein
VIIAVADVAGRKTLVVALDDQDLAELLDGRRLSVDVTGLPRSTAAIATSSTKRWASIKTAGSHSA